MLFKSKKKAKNFYMPGQEIRINEKQSIQTFYPEKKEDANPFKPKIILLILGFSLVYLIICIRLILLCSSNNLLENKYKNSNQKLSAGVTEKIRRADIIDRNGNILATSLPTTDLHKVVENVENPEEIARELQKIIPDLNYDYILKRLQMKKKFVYIKRNLTPQQIYQINALGHHELEFQKSEKRIYPYKNLFAHIVGYTDTDNIGIAGLEKKMDERLTSSDIPLKLSLDLVVQDIIHEELSNAVKKFNAEGGVAILMDVNTGKIIAMVSLPDFDPNIKKFESVDVIKNFATEGTYEPGSVFKVFNAALGLNTGKITLTEKFDTTKDFKVRGKMIRGYREVRTWQTVGDILINSSNLGSARIALKVGRDDQREFLKNLGMFDKVPNIEVTERAHPILPPKRWTEETVATVSYGYGISVSPLHIITAFSGIVNGGIYHEPTILADGPERKSHRVVSEKVSEMMRPLLRDVVIKGSGKNANVKGYEVAGKTGTANKIENGKYVKNAVRTSFISTFPASNPQYALLVMMDEPKASKETYGFSTAGWNSVPTAGKIIARIAPQLNVPANFLLEEQKKHIIEASYR